jgi:predicted DCC family thiol-disulfide oxidoreductase YuxK
MNELSAGKDIILFDGDCNFCTGWVLWVIRHDKKDRYRFSASQLPVAQKLLHAYGERADASVLLIRNNRMYDKSDAALKILSGLGRGYSIFKVLFIFPKVIRDFVYSFIAARRYQWFGKRDQCYVPDQKLKSKFL